MKNVVLTFTFVKKVFKRGNSYCFIILFSVMAKDSLSLYVPSLYNVEVNLFAIKEKNKIEVEFD